MEVKLDTVVAKLKTELLSIRAGRPDPSQLDHLTVYLSSTSSSVPLKSLASVSVHFPHSLVVQLYDPTALKDVDKSIREAKGMDLVTDMDVDSNSVIVTIPKATKELRVELSKTLSKKGEECKTQCRAIRQSVLHAMKGEQYTEEENAKVKARVQALLDHSVQEVTDLIKEKEREINQV